MCPKLLTFPQHLFSHVTGQHIAKWSDPRLYILQNFMSLVIKKGVIEIVWIKIIIEVPLILLPSRC